MTTSRFASSFICILSTIAGLASPLVPTSAEAQTLLAEAPYIRTYAEGRRNVQLLGGKSAADVWVSAKVMTYPSEHAGVVFRASNLDNYYECFVNARHKLIELNVYKNGSRRTLKRYSMATLSTNRQYQLWVGMFADAIYVYLDGKRLFVTRDGTLRAAGLTGTMSYYKGANFRDFASYGYD